MSQALKIPFLNSSFRDLSSSPCFFVLTRRDIYDTILDCVWVCYNYALMP